LASANEDVAAVDAGRDWNGFAFGRDLQELSAGRNFTGWARAFHDISAVAAGFPPSGFVGPLDDPGDFTGFLFAFGNIGSVSATGNVAGTLAARSDIRDVSAWGDASGLV
jgi:hypothetical protein